MATLTTTEILQDTLDAFKTIVPMLTAFSTDFKTASVKKGETVMGHIAGLPVVQDYDATAGYKANQVEADALLTDVPVVMDQLKHVPVRVKYLTQLASRKDLYNEAVRNQAYVLGKSMIDAVLAKVTDANVTYETVEPSANTDLDTLEVIRGALNDQNASAFGRFGFVNTTVARYLQADTRVGSSDFYAQLNGGSGYRQWGNIAGFQNVWEYPDLPANSVNLTGFFGDRRAAVIVTALPEANTDGASLGIPEVVGTEVVTDPDSGLSLLGLRWQDQGTLDFWLTMALLYGTAVGAQGGGADAVTDKAAHKLVSA